MNKQEFLGSLLSQLNNSQRANLKSETVIELLRNKVITLDKALDLTKKQRANIQRASFESIQKVLGAKAIGFNDLLELPLLTQIHNLNSDRVNSLLKAKIITLDQALGLTRKQIHNLNSDRVNSLLKAKIITLDQALLLTKRQFNNFIKNKKLFTLLKDKTIELNKILGATREGINNLKSGNVRSLFKAKIITLDQALGLTSQQFNNLKNNNVSLLLKDKIITVNQALDLTSQQFNNLKNNNVSLLLKDKIITVNQALDLTSNHINNLDALADKLLPLLKSKWITFDVLKDPQLDVLKNPKLDDKTYQTSFFLLIKNDYKESKYHLGQYFFKRTNSIRNEACGDIGPDEAVNTIVP